jgi:nitroreductase
MDGRLEAILAAAGRAPSGDNTQPWRFAVEGEAIALELEPSRDPSPMNAGQRMARIGAGAALENLLRTAHDLGFATELDPHPAPALARVRLVGQSDVDGQVAPEIGRRTTNRRPYDGRAVPPDVLDRLALASPEREGVAALWVVGDDRLGAAARAIGRADAAMFGEPAMRNAFLAKVRFDRPAGEAVEEGLSLSSLELSGADRVALRVMKHAPDALLKLGRASAVFEAKARALVAGSAGLLVVAAADDEPATDLAVGRAAEQAWLALTAEGLAAQPMMSLPVLENVLANGDDSLRSALGVERVRGLLDEFRSLVPELAGRRPAWLMRFGFAPPPSGRTGRLPLARVTSLADAPPGVPS